MKRCHGCEKRVRQPAMAVNDERSAYKYWFCAACKARLFAAVDADPNRRQSAACIERAERQRRLSESPDAVVHGTTSTYRNWGCRCLECRAANKAACAEWKESRATAPEAASAGSY